MVEFPSFIVSLLVLQVIDTAPVLNEKWKISFSDNDGNNGITKTDHSTLLIHDPFTETVVHELFRGRAVLSDVESSLLRTFHDIPQYRNVNNFIFSFINIDELTSTFMYVTKFKSFNVHSHFMVIVYNVGEGALQLLIEFLAVSTKVSNFRVWNLIGNITQGLNLFVQTENIVCKESNWLYKINTILHETGKIQTTYIPLNQIFIVGTFDYNPSIVKLGTNSYSGYEMQLVKEISRYLNATLDIRESPNNEMWGEVPDLNNPNSTGKGLIGMLLNHTVDFIFAGLWCTDDQKDLCICSSSYDKSYGVVAVPNPDQVLDWLQIIKPFSWCCWIHVLGTFILGTIFLKMYDAAENQSSEYFEIVMFLLGAVLGISDVEYHHFRSYLFRYFNSVWQIYSLILGVSYSCFLTEQLTIRNEGFVVNSLEELAVSELTWGGSIFFKDMLQLGGKRGDYYDILINKFVIEKKFDDLIPRIVFDKDSALFETEDHLKYVRTMNYTNSNGEPLFHITTERFNTHDQVLYFPFGSQYRDIINKKILLVVQSGLYPVWKEQYMHRTMKSKVAETKVLGQVDNRTALSNGNFLGVYLFYALALLSTLSVFVLEVTVSVFSNQ